MTSESKHRTELSDNAPVGPAPTPERVKTTDAKVTDTKVRVQQAAEQAREGLSTAKTKAAEVGGQVKGAVQNPDNAPKVKSGGAAAAGATALAAAAWVVRRRRNRPKTSWQKTERAAKNAAHATAKQARKAAAAAPKQARKAAAAAPKQARKAAAAAPEPTRKRLGTTGIVLTALAAVAAYLGLRRSSSNNPS